MQTADKKPRFSLLMANYNQEKYIAEAIESVVNQTFRQWELVIVDDCSTDKSLQVVKPYLEDSRIRLLRNDKNIGYIRTLKRLIDESRTDILGLLDSDDALEATALEKMYEAHVKNPDSGFIYSNFTYCDSYLKPVKPGFCEAIPRVAGKNTVLRYDIVGPFRTFKKEQYFETPGYDEEILYAEDKDLVLKLEEVTDLFFVDKSLYLYRVLPGSQSHDPAKKGTMKSSFCLAKYKAYRRRLGTKIPSLTSKEMSDVLFDSVHHCIKAGNWKRTVFFIYGAVRLAPLNIMGLLRLFFRGAKFIPRRLLFKKDSKKLCGVDQSGQKGGKRDGQKPRYSHGKCNCSDV